MTAPGTIMMAKMIVPETETPKTMGTVRLSVEQTDVNVIDAAGRGTGEGLHLALNVGAMLISFLALIALVDAVLGVAGLSLELIFGWLFAPIAWSMGVPWHDAPRIGNLLGTRMALNEFVAYSKLGPMKDSLDPRSFTIATFALCGFANFSSIGIQIGGIGALAPNCRRRDLRPARVARHVRRHAGELHDGDNRRIPALARVATDRCTETGEDPGWQGVTLHAMDYYEKVTESRRRDAIRARVWNPVPDQR